MQLDSVGAPAFCYQRPGSFTSLGVTHWAKLWFTFGLYPMSLTAEAKAAHVPGSYFGISSHSSSELFEVPQFQSLEVFLSSLSLFTADSGWLEHEGLQATSPFRYCII